MAGEQHGKEAIYPSLSPSLLKTARSSVPFLESHGIRNKYITPPGRKRSLITGTSPRSEREGQRCGQPAEWRRLLFAGGVSRREEGLDIHRSWHLHPHQDCIGYVCSVQFPSSASYSFQSTGLLPRSIGLFLGILFIFM